MLVLVFLFLQLASSNCNPVCGPNKDCVQVGDNTFSCLEEGNAILIPATSRRSLFDICEGCEFQTVLEVQTPSGTLVKKQQTYFGIPIVGFHVTELVDADNEVVHSNGNILDVDDDLPEVSPAQDLEILLAPYGCEEVESDLAITFINSKAHLIYDVKCWTDLADENIIGHMWNIEFDAHDGNILNIFDGVDSVKSSATRRLLQRSGDLSVDGTDVFDAVGGNTRAGEYQHSFQLRRDGDECTYDSEHVYVANNEGSSSQNNETPWSFPCNLLPEQNDAVNGANSPLNDAFAFGLQFWNLYQEWYDMAPLSEKLGLVVHYGEGNAMWDGRKMYFADGDNRYHPYVSLDVVAHEVSHGTTQHNSNLVYRGQSGGINEAFSDMAGVTAEFYYFGTTEFEIGSKIRKESGAMRYMCDPSRDGRSIGHVDEYRSGMDVHHSSGVFNNAFCELSNKAQWDPRKAFHVFLTANRVYWDRNTNFEQGANDAIQASVDLGYGSEDICEAFSMVGIVGSGCDGNMTPAPQTSSTSTTRTPSTGSPQRPNDDCVDRFRSCDLIVRNGHCSLMADMCPLSCGLCSDTTADPENTTSLPEDDVSTMEPTSTPEDDASTMEPTSTHTEESKVIMIVSDVPYACEIQGVSEIGDTLTFEQGNCVEYNLD